MLAAGLIWGLFNVGFAVIFSFGPSMLVPGAVMTLAAGLAESGRPPVGADGAIEPERAAPEAWLVALKDDGRLSDFDRLTLRQAVTLVALELLRDRVAGETERRLAGDVLLAMINGELSGAELVRRLVEEAQARGLLVGRNSGTFPRLESLLMLAPPLVVASSETNVDRTLTPMVPPTSVSSSPSTSNSPRTRARRSRSPARSRRSRSGRGRRAG